MTNNNNNNKNTILNYLVQEKATEGINYTMIICDQKEM